MQGKPPLNIGKMPNPPTFRNSPLSAASQPSQNQTQLNANQGPPSSAVEQLTYDDISGAVQSLQDRRSVGNSPQSAGPSYGAVQQQQQQQQQSLPPRPPSFAFSQGAPTLPTINSGEALDWGDIVPSVRSVGGDPFAEGQETAPVQAQSATMRYAQGLVQPPPPAPAVMARASTNDAYLQAQPQNMHASYSDYSSSNGYSRPPSAAYSSYDAPSYQSQPSEEQSSYYAQGSQAHTVSSHGHSGYSAESHGALPTHYNAQGELMVDHYGPETGAYSSAVDTPPRRNTVRSRSATPMGPGGEEYVVLDEEGSEYDPSDQTHDPEKGDYDYEDDYEEEPVQYYDAGNRLGYDEKMTPINEYPDTPITTQHYGPVPVGRVVRRNQQKKRVQLTYGNLAIDLPVPTKLVLPLRREEEMKTTRYTAVTCDPDDFVKNNFVLRQNLYGRTTEMFIVITMYNEDEVLFCRTLHGVMQNISHLCTRKNSRTWGPDAWKKVVVCIVADGRKKVHPRVLDCLGALGVYQHGPFKQKAVTFKPVTAHLFEYTTAFGLDENLHFRYPDKGIVPTQILFCLKEKNAKKINSHRWFFNAFAPLLKPNVCVLIDVGTRPAHKSLYHLWKTFDLNSNVGGACGEIAAYKGRYWKGLLNPLVASQDFEYKISNILDKPTESFFGYISVLPGAFSAYRYIALQNNKKGVGPLASYFKGEVLHGHETDIFTSNMYLAEDRILCFELVAKEGHNWVLRYVKSAVGETDVPEALPEFISQRRRWLNGSFFASVYAIAHLSQIMRSGHSTGRKIALVVETIYNVINLVFSWFALGNFYLFFNIVTSSLNDSSFGIPGIKYFNTIVQYTYASLIVACFLFSMGNKPRSAPWKYKITSILFAILNVYAIVCAVICAIQAARQGGSTYSVMLFSVIITYGVYVASSLVALEPWHMITSFIPYILLSPTYVNILNIYAYSNLDDISWGTKQDDDVDADLGAVISNGFSQVDIEIADSDDIDQMYIETLANLRTRKPAAANKRNAPLTEGEKEQQARAYYANVRSNVLLTWVLSNGLLLVAILSVGDPSETFNSGANATKIYMTFILAFVAITNIIRFLGSTLYMCAYILQG